MSLFAPELASELRDLISDKEIESIKEQGLTFKDDGEEEYKATMKGVNALDDLFFIKHTSKAVIKEFNNIKDLKLVLKILNDCPTNRKIRSFDCESCRCFDVINCCVKNERMTMIRFIEWLIEFVSEINGKRFKELLSPISRDRIIIKDKKTGEEHDGDLSELFE